jgi:GT2 family glycosyltransferase
MDNKIPLVSIIVRTKDRPKLLKRALQSIALQTYKPVEVILVNDGGCDLNIDEIEKILGDILLNYIRIAENKGRAHAGNVGINNAQGKYVGFLDDDDEFYPEHVSTLVDFLTQNGCRVAYTDSEIVKYDYNKEKDELILEDRYVLFSEDFSYENLLFGNYIPLMCLLFDAQLLHKQKFDENFDLYEDWDLLIQIAEKASFHHIEKVTAKYNQNLGEQITANSKSHRNSYMQLAEKHIDKIVPKTLYHNWQMLIDWRELAKGLEEPIVIIKSLKKLIEINNRVIEDKEKEIEDKEKIIDEKVKVIEDRERVIDEKVKIINEKEKVIENKESTLSQRDKEIISLHTHLITIQSTLGWQMLESFRQFIDRLLPFGSKWRYYYDLLIKSIKVLKTQGIKVFYYKVRKKLKGYKSFNVPRSEIAVHIPHTEEPVDIILPIFNAYEDLQECIKSVLINTDMNSHRLIVIDDKSTDQRVEDYLKALKEELKSMNIVFLSNEKNLGFAKTVNRGMMFSDRDVIILNTDTIVSKEWVEKLRIAAYSNARIATATPFSNNATICSIPDFCKNNLLPEPFDIISFAEFIDRISLRHYPAIPTGVGFCMYIKQKILDEIGYFDETCFDKGYGEENDFCTRAIKKGYVHILDDATFIYHKGGSSFTSDVKHSKEQEALNTLDKLHPEYLPNVNRFIRENPLQDIHHYIKFRIELENRKSASADIYQTINR